MNLIRAPFKVNGHEFTGGTLSYTEVVSWPTFECGELSRFPDIEGYDFNLHIWSGPVDRLVEGRLTEWLFEWANPAGITETLTIHCDTREWNLADNNLFACGRISDVPFIRISIPEIKPKRIVWQVAGYLWRHNGKTVFRPTGPRIRSEETRHSR